MKMPFHTTFVFRGLICFCALFATSCTAPKQARQSTCSAETAAQAEQMAPKLSSWRELYSFYSDKAACDDGAIAEGVTESTSVLLIKQWHSVSELLTLLKADQGFENFFFRHVNELTPQTVAHAVIEQTGNQCPQGGEDFCAKLKLRLK